MRTAFPPQLINDETRRNLFRCDNDDTIIMLALALPFLLLGTVNIPPQYAREYSGHATALVDSLTANYNVQVPPHVTQRSARSVAVSEAGTDVKVQLRVFKVESVAAANGQMRLKVWLRQNWKDERLSWNESAWGGVGMVSFATDPENRMLWVPDLGVYNSLVPSDDSLQYSTASVYSDGSVFWSRPGLIEVMCKFSGLVAFPFDNLTCAIEVGGWTWSGGHQGIEPNAAGAASFSSQEATAGSSFTEYWVYKVAAEMVTYEYPCCPSEPWPVLIYTVTLNRSSEYYVQLLLWPYVLLTSVSFLVFFMSFEVGERLSFGITLILAVEVSKGVFSAMIPVCGEALWLSLFVNLNLIFCIIALAETCVVLFLAYHNDPHLLPPWIIDLFMATCGSCLGRQTAGKAGQVLPLKGAPKTSEARRLQNLLEPSAASRFARAWGLADDGATPRAPLTAEEGLERLTLYERYFHALDEEARESLPAERVFAWFSFTSQAEETAIRRVMDTQSAESDDNDERFVIGEWMEVCAALLSNVPLSRLEALHETYDVVRTKRNAANQRRWQRAANWVDRQARLWIPSAYLILLSLLACVDLTDTYAPVPTNASNLEITGDDQPQEMFQGIGPYTFVRIPLLFIVPVVVISLLGGYFIVVRIAQSKKLLESAAIERARKQRNLASFTRQSGRQSGRVETPPRSGAVRLNKNADDVQTLEAEDFGDSPRGRHSA